MTLGIILTLNILGWILFILIFRIVLRRIVNPRRILSQVEQEIESLLTELNGSTERNIRILEEAVRRLKGGVEEADKRIKVLRSEQQRRSEAPETPREYTHLAAHKPLSLKVVEEPPNTETPPEAVVKSSEESETDAEDPRGSIMRLHRQGLDARLIAAKVGRPLGEVELIISISE